MKRPSFQFYPGDWRNNAKLRRCTWSARGVWIELLGLLHDSDTYGVLHWPLKEIAQALGAPARELNELVRNGVLYGCEKGSCEPMVYRPKSGRIEGVPVTLVAAQPGPIWYSPRMVRDEYVRTKRGVSTRFGEGQGDAPNPSPKGGIGEWQGDTPKPTPKPPPNRWQGDGASSSSSVKAKAGSDASGVDLQPPRAENRSLESAVPVVDGAGEPLAPDATVPITDGQARTAVLACVALRKLGCRVQPAMPPLLDVVAAGATVEQLALTAAELALRKAGMFDDPDLHPELLERFASGLPSEQLGLTTTQYAALRAAAPSIQYLAATLRGRAEDAAQGVTHAISFGRDSAGAAPRRQESAAERAERKRRAGDAREDAAGGGSGG